MVSSSAKTVNEYLKSLPDDRRRTIAKVRAAIRKNLPKGYVETMQYGGISYSVPLKTYPKTYNGQALSYAGLASQKNHMAVYLMGIYGIADLRRWFEAEYKKTGKRMDVGKCCVRFRKLDDLPLELVGEAIARVPMKDFIALYEKARGGSLRKARQG